MQGLGNMTGNALYYCRLRTIADNVHEAYVTEDMYPEQELFWLDSLCVPTHSSRYRDIAIGMMDTVYERAWSTLVMDSTLAASTKSNKFQACFRLWISPWASRLWCLTELVLARRLRIKFKDGMYHFETMMDDIRALYFRARWCAAIYDTLFRGFVYWFAFDSQQDLSFDGLAQNAYGPLLTIIAGRTISKAKDEAFCLTLFLRLPRNAILECEPGQEWTAFWSCQEQVPEEIIFSQAERLNVQGLRWAPRSVLEWATQRKVVRGPTAKRIANGLSVVFEGFIIDPLQLQASKAYLFRADKVYALLKMDWQVLTAAADYIPNPVVILPKDFDGQRNYAALASLSDPQDLDFRHPIKVEMINVHIISALPCEPRFPVSEARRTPGPVSWVVS